MYNVFENIYPNENTKINSMKKNIRGSIKNSVAASQDTCSLREAWTESTTHHDITEAVNRTSSAPPQQKHSGGGL